LAWSAAALLAVAAILASIGYVRRAPRPLEPVRFEIFPPARGVFDNLDGPVTVSPDGRQIVFGVRDETGRSFLWVRSLGSLESHRLEETEDAYDPIRSPHGRSLALRGNSTLPRMPASGGPVQS